MIHGYKQGADISILDCFYQYPTKNEQGKYEDDFISILYKDNITGKKNHQVIYKPDYEFYVAKDYVPLTHNLFFIPEEDTVKHTEIFTKLLKTIADITGNSDFYYNNIQCGNRRANKELHTLNNIFNSDMDINDHYRFRFDKLYKNETPIITKGYFDIEVDTINMRGDFPEMGECPVNAVSYIFNNKVRSFILRNPYNKLIQEFEDSIDKNLFNELQNFIIDNVGGLERAKKFNVANLEFEFLFYDYEIELIRDLFSLINVEEPDFLLAWNMAFDIPYLYERILQLGYNPAEIMCHPSFKSNEKVAKYFIDEEHKNEYSLRGDKYTISAHTVYLDQLIHFASRRKGQAAFPNFKLDTAGSIIAKVRKLNYSHITTNISKLPYLDFKTFIFYNIMDTIVQNCIEEEVQDINYVCGKCIMNNTRYDKVHRQTVYLANRATKEFAARGYIIGNNVNKYSKSRLPTKTNEDYNEEDKKAEKFAGAIVTDPRNNSDHSKINNLGQILNIMDNLVDFDFKSLYPSITREHNMAPNTQIGKILIPEQVHMYENPFGNEKYDRGGSYIEDLTSQNIILFCHRWLGYTNFREILEDIEYYYRFIEMPSFDIYNNPRKLFRKFEGTPGPVKLFHKLDPNEPRKLFTKITQPMDMTPYINRLSEG